MSYGYVPDPGYYPAEYATSITRPDMFRSYLEKNIEALIKNHGEHVSIGLTKTPMPIDFAFDESFSFDPYFSGKKELENQFSAKFTRADMRFIDDAIVHAKYGPSITGDLPPNHWYAQPMLTGIRPLVRYTAPRIDFGINKLMHLTGTSAEVFQNFVVCTNFKTYIEAFKSEFTNSYLKAVDNPKPKNKAYLALVESGNVVTYNQNIPDAKARFKAVAGDKFVIGDQQREAAFPSYHLVREDGQGISLINVHQAASNVENILTHVAVLREKTILMQGISGGLTGNLEKRAIFTATLISTTG